MTDDPPKDVEKHWRDVDAALARGEMDPLDAAHALKSLGLVSDVEPWHIPLGEDAYGTLIGVVWVLLPTAESLAPGPSLILDLEQHYGGPRIYRPLPDTVLPDTARGLPARQANEVSEEGRVPQ